MPYVTLAEAAQMTLDVLSQRKASYQQILASVDVATAIRSMTGREFLLDIMKFCRATEPCWGTTAADTARLVGRNEVWHRIAQHAHLTPEELYDLYGGQYPLQQLNEDKDA